MERFSPKIEIINHFDNLINRIDIDVDSSLEKFNDKQLLSEILKSSENSRRDFKYRYFDFDVKFFDTIDSSKPTLESWPESTKVVDYLKQIRMKTIEELKKAQEETLEYYKLNSDRFKSELNNEKNIEEMKIELFAQKFYFQVNFKQTKKRLLPFNVFTFVTDFYLTQSDIDLIEKLINSEIESKLRSFNKSYVFHDKTVLPALHYKCFIDNLLNFPDHVIHVRKQDIKSIVLIHYYNGVNLTSSSTIDLSKLVDLNLIDQYEQFWHDTIEYNIEGLYSLKRLHFEANTDRVYFSIKNLPSLTNLSLALPATINEKILTGLLNQVPYIQELYLDGYFSYFNLDNLVNLRVISLNGIIRNNLNMKLFENLSNQLEDIKIGLTNIDEENFFKLFDGYNFPYLVDFTLRYFNIKRLRKEFINRLPTHKRLNISHCNIEVIENDSFSNMQQLNSLNLSRNRIKLIKKNAFLNLKNLETLDLSFNKLTKFDPKFIGLLESVECNVKYNKLGY